MKIEVEISEELFLELSTTGPERPSGKTTPHSIRICQCRGGGWVVFDVLKAHKPDAVAEFVKHITQAGCGARK